MLWKSAAEFLCENLYGKWMHQEERSLFALIGISEIRKVIIG